MVYSVFMLQASRGAVHLAKHGLYPVLSKALQCEDAAVRREALNLTRNLTLSPVAKVREHLREKGVVDLLIPLLDAELDVASCAALLLSLARLCSPDERFLSLMASWIVSDDILKYTGLPFFGLPLIQCRQFAAAYGYTSLLTSGQTVPPLSPSLPVILTEILNRPAGNHPLDSDLRAEVTRALTALNPAASPPSVAVIPASSAPVSDTPPTDPAPNLPPSDSALSLPPSDVAPAPPPASVDTPPSAPPRSAPASFPPPSPLIPARTPPPIPSSRPPVSTPPAVPPRSQSSRSGLQPPPVPSSSTRLSPRALQRSVTTADDRVGSSQSTPILSLAPTRSPRATPPSPFGGPPRSSHGSTSPVQSGAPPVPERSPASSPSRGRPPPIPMLPSSSAGVETASDPGATPPSSGGLEKGHTRHLSHALGSSIMQGMMSRSASSMSANSTPLSSAGPSPTTSSKSSPRTPVSDLDFSPLGPLPSPPEPSPREEDVPGTCLIYLRSLRCVLVCVCSLPSCSEGVVCERH